ncbi:hypothetical protein KVR01_005454 [Diaporthe batatas]|uniref:uncharacterized protein n=1 Tax=Diaporthe batatas TaxID=748121 RepID=UPI001D03C790|nr:uncharacterized protein KVR01_005454 [Diaporthe batatas]KAG8165179.1 hypothetical protein KVR01_005454 [Diaporthe batatas]
MHIQIAYQPQPDECRSRQAPTVSRKTPARSTIDAAHRQQLLQQLQRQHQQAKQQKQEEEEEEKRQRQQQQQQQQTSSAIKPLKPQFHSRKCHHTYNATRHLPQAVWIRSARLSKDENDKPTVVYEVVLCHEHNRACIVNRTWEDFEKLKSGLGSWRNAPAYSSPRDVDGLQQFLCEAISKKGREIAMEFFLRRRMDDCGGS